MTSAKFEFDPEVQAMLSELLSNPSSALFRWPTTPISPSGIDVTSQSVSRLTDSRIMDEIATVQRLEFALLFRGASIIRIYSLPNERHYLHRNLTSSKKVYIPDLLTWRRQATEQLKLGSAVLEDAERRILEKCIIEGLSGVSVTTLALASMRLQPTDSARIYIALDLTYSGQPRAALHLLRNVIAGPSGRIEASYAWENIGFIYSQLDDFPAAMHAARNAAQLAPDRPDPLMNWLFNACLGVDNVQAKISAERIDSMLDEKDESLQLFLEILHEQAELNQWCPSDETLSLLGMIRPSAGAASGAIMDTILAASSPPRPYGLMQRKGNMGIPPMGATLAGASTGD